MKLLIILPAFNEAKVIAGVLAQIKGVAQKLPFDREVVLIDDGSGDQTAALAAKAGAIVLCHVINRGLGA